MKVFSDIDHLPGFKNAVVTIGTFDGVHLGHQKIIAQLKSEAERVAGETVIITFNPHPRKIILNKPEQIQLITTIEERIELLWSKGIDNLVIVPFTKGFSELEPEKYVEDFLFERFKPAVVIIGYDHRFGKDRRGDYRLMEEYSKRGWFELKEISQQLINHNTVSSTLIRQSLSEGNVSQATSLLGHDFFFEGVVMRGDQRGRTIGYPTANLQVLSADKIIPANGVYAVEVEVKMERSGRRRKGMMNIGVRPTVDGTTKTIEVHIFDYSADIYGTVLRVYVKEFVRNEQKFTSLDELKAQLATDREQVLKILK